MVRCVESGNIDLLYFSYYTYLYSVFCNVTLYVENMIISLSIALFLGENKGSEE